MRVRCVLVRGTVRPVIDASGTRCLRISNLGKQSGRQCYGTGPRKRVPGGRGAREQFRGRRLPTPNRLDVRLVEFEFSPCRLAHVRVPTCAGGEKAYAGILSRREIYDFGRARGQLVEPVREYTHEGGFCLQGEFYYPYLCITAFRVAEELDNTFK